MKLRIQKEIELILQLRTKKGERNGHNPRGGSPRCHSTTPSPKSHSDGTTARDGASALALWGPQACCSPEAGCLQLFSARPGWSASTWLGLFCLCALEPSSALLPVEEQHTILVLETLTALRDKFLPHRAPHSQWRVRVDTTCAGVHNSLS